MGWGFQTDKGHQTCGVWLEIERTQHVNFLELIVVKVWLNRYPKILMIVIQFSMDNVTAMHCIQKHGEEIFGLAVKRNISRSA